MDYMLILQNSIWAGLFACGLGILLTAPSRYLAMAFLCGFAGRFIRDVSIGMGQGQNWATVLAAASIVLLAFTVVRRDDASPVVVVTGILPLGAAMAMFAAIWELMKVSSATGEALEQASLALNASIGKVFTTSLAIAVGLAVGMAIVKNFVREEELKS